MGRSDAHHASVFLDDLPPEYAADLRAQAEQAATRTRAEATKSCAAAREGVASEAAEPRERESATAQLEQARAQIDVVIDDCWFDPQRSATGELRGNPERFPSGMKALADYIHSKGLKFGIYEVPTKETCAQRGGVRGTPS